MEYHYVDEERLDKYLEEYGSPVIIQKEQTKGVELSFTPKLTFTTSEKLVPPTTPEKIEYLLDNLRKHELLEEGRYRGREAFSNRAKPFHLETCEAVKTFIDAALPEVMIPSTANLSIAVDEIYGTDTDFAKRPGEFGRRREQLLRKQKQEALARARELVGDFKGLNIWISDRHHVDPSTTEKRGQLFLIVGFPKDVETHFEAWSAHSAFTGLLSELRSYFQKSILHTVARESDNPNSQFQNDFLADPLKALRSFGARVANYSGQTTRVAKYECWFDSEAARLIHH